MVELGSRAVQGRCRATQKKKKELRSGRQCVLREPRELGLTHRGVENGRERRRNE